VFLAVHTYMNDESDQICPVVQSAKEFTGVDGAGIIAWVVTFAASSAPDHEKMLVIGL
jgi:hypothetical protein